MDCLAEGIPFVGTYRAGKRRSKLRYCQIYKSPRKSRYAKGAKWIGHAVVLIGGGMEKGKKYFYCVNSWKDKFCPRRNSQGEIIKAGIGKIRACDLTKNVVKLSQPEKTDPCRRLNVQDGFDITNKNFILMMALKNEFAQMSRRAKQVNLKDAENVQCDDEVFNKFREDHLVYGPFCDDEAGYFSEEMEDSHLRQSHRSEIISTEGLGTQLSMLTVAGGGEAVWKTYTEEVQAGSMTLLNSKKSSRQAAQGHSTPRNAPGRQPGATQLQEMLQAGSPATQLQEMSCTQVTRFGGCCWNVFLVPSQSDNYPARMFISCTVKMRSKSAPPLVLGGPPER